MKGIDGWNDEDTLEGLEFELDRISRRVGVSLDELSETTEEDAVPPRVLDLVEEAWEALRPAKKLIGDARHRRRFEDTRRSDR